MLTQNVDAGTLGGTVRVIYHGVNPASIREVASNVLACGSGTLKLHLHESLHFSEHGLVNFVRCVVAFNAAHAVDAAVEVSVRRLAAHAKGWTAVAAALVS